MKIAYLINRYPAPSHGFIRREIDALRALDETVFVYSIRRFPGALVSEADRQAAKSTCVILEKNWRSLLWQVKKTLLVRPIRSLKTMVMAVRMGLTSDRGVFKHLAYFIEACALRCELEQCGADHLHAHFGTNPATVAMFCHSLGGPAWSFTAHGPEEFVRGHRISLSRKIDLAQFVVAVSDFGIGQLRNWCSPTQFGKLKRIRCGLDERLLHSSITAVPDVAHVVCVGRLCPEKMQHVLIAAVAQLAARNVQLTLTLVGDGATRQQLQQQVAELHLEERIRFAGWCNEEQVRHEILSARIMVLPSAAEGLPVAIMEAFALSRPVISTKVAGIPELVEPGLSGWLVTPGNVDELANAIQSALSTPVVQFGEMASIGRQRVLELHDSNKSAKALQELFMASLKR